MIRLFLSTLFFICLIHVSQGHSGFNDSRTSDWVDLNKDYHKLSITQTGIQRVLFSSLPARYKASKETLQLWHRGKQVAIIAIDEDSFLFYGETNDGSSDSLLFRPFNARMNRYESLYSDKGSYFITIGEEPSFKSKTQSTITVSGTSEPYHLEKKVKLFKSQYGFTTATSPGTALNHSYFVSANTWTGPSIVSVKPTPQSPLDTLMNEIINLQDYLQVPNTPLQIELLLTGLHQGPHAVKVEVASNSVRDFTTLGVRNFSGWESSLFESKVSHSKINSPDEQLTIRLSTTTKTNNDWFGLTYYKVEYPQLVKLSSSHEKVFHFPASINTTSRISIQGASSSTLVYDISDPYNVQIIKGVIKEGIWDGMVQRNNGKELKLLATTPENIHHINEFDSVNLKSLYATSSVTNDLKSLSQFNYFIITSSNLKDGAVEYAKYRESRLGGSYKTLVVDVKDIYNVYNFGEPSPVAIKHFAAAIERSTADVTNHHIFLIGKSITYPIAVIKDLPDEVPSIGDPGSDILLVSGLNGNSADYPSMAIGRLKVFTSEQVIDYLDKVRTYEHDLSNIGWRKNILHMSGGANMAEINTLQSILSSLAHYAENSTLGANVIPIVKKTVNTERVDISSQVNAGMGMMTYFGHGSQNVTDLDFGRISDASRGYTENHRYAFMYFNGCGVGNIFSARARWILSDDWIGSPSRGAVSILANSYLSYVSTSNKHLSEFYNVIFKKGNESLSIGQVASLTARNILSKNHNDYDLANIHQMVLQGDPAVKLFQLNKVDYLLDESTGVHIYSKDQKSALGSFSTGKIAINIRNEGAYDVNENTSVAVDIHYKGDKIIKKTLPLNSFPFKHDTIWVDVEDLKNITSISVFIDPDDSIDEEDELNNRVDITLDWSEISDYTYYPNTPQLDVIAPQLHLLFNGEIAKNRVYITSNTAFTILIEDDRTLDDMTDGITVYLKECWGGECIYSPYKLDAAEVKLDGVRKKMVSFTPNLREGEYEILIRATDRAGNISEGEGYTVQFRVDNEKYERGVIVVYPNPAKDYIVVSVNGIIGVLDAGSYKLDNLTGITVLEGIIGRGSQTYIKIPDNLPAGAYILRTTLIRNSKKEEISRRIIIQ